MAAHSRMTFVLLALLFGRSIHALMKPVDGTSVGSAEVKLESCVPQVDEIKQMIIRTFGEERGTEMIENVMVEPEKYLDDELPIIVELAEALEKQDSHQFTAKEYRRLTNLEVMSAQQDIQINEIQENLAETMEMLQKVSEQLMEKDVAILAHDGYIYILIASSIFSTFMMLVMTCNQSKNWEPLALIILAWIPVLLISWYFFL